MQDKIEKILSVFTKAKYEKPFISSKHSTMGVGNNFPLGLYPKNKAELIEMVAYLSKNDIPFEVVGNCSNILMLGDDKTVIIKTDFVNKYSIKGQYAYFDCGFKLSSLKSVCPQKCLGGFEFLDGIPATIGGATFINAGAFEREIFDILEKILVYSIKDNKVKILDKKSCKSNYRESIFTKKKEIVLGVLFKLENDNPVHIEDNLIYYRNQRKKLPNGKSLGCVFKNNFGVSAGYLIDSSNLKGVGVGGAVISSQHANFIINENNATLKDIISLIDIIKKKVNNKYGVLLEEEIRYLGEK